VSSEALVVRRATVDDLAELERLWELHRYPVLDLERHLTEFQVIRSAQGELLGALGFHIEGKHGLIHSEGLLHPEAEGSLHPLFWERIRSLVRNHGLARLWTRDLAPFWHQCGFADASAEVLQKLPKGFGDPHARWMTLQVREEVPAAVDLELELELFQQATRAGTESTLAQARRLRSFAYVVACVLTASAIAGAIFVTQRAMRFRESTSRRPAARTDHPQSPSTNVAPSSPVPEALKTEIER
jgi:N-acetylglutamate synthase-like GNAT family acetyltransferase